MDQIWLTRLASMGYSNAVLIQDVSTMQVMVLKATEEPQNEQPILMSIEAADEEDFEPEEEEESVGAEERVEPVKVEARKYHFCEFEGCDKKYANANHLKVHMRVHTGDRPFQCPFMCGKSFTNSYGYRSHIRTHTNERPYPCDFDGCAKSFKTSGDLLKHKRTHTGYKPFKCTAEGCDKSFTTSNILKTHLRVHTGERPFKCPEPDCGKTFASVTNCQNHARIHSGERPFQCEFQNCGKRFTEYSSLYKHHSVHSVSKPFLCDVCLKTFRQLGSLNSHRKTVHRLEAADKPEEQQLPSIAEPEEPPPEKTYQPISITVDSQQKIVLLAGPTDDN